MRARRIVVSSLLVGLLAVGLGAQRPATGGAITAADLKSWLGYLASDQLEGRQVYTEGLGLAGSYIAERLQDWGVKPAGDNGTYFQAVKVQGVRTASRSSVTVEVNGQARTFKDGEGITFPRNMGGKQTLSSADIQFAGYGLQIPAASIDDYAGTSPKGKIVIFMGQGPATLPAGSNRLLGARARNALEKGASAVISPAGAAGGGRGRGDAGPAQPPQPAPAAAPGGEGRGGPPAAGRGAGQAGGFGRGAAQVDNGDFTTVQRYDAPVPPAVTAADEFFEFLFSGAAVKYAELKDKAAKREPLPAVALKGVKVTFNVDADYTVVRTRLTRNVVGIVEGTDPKLKDTYVGFGAHYDHVGYRENGVVPTGGQANPGGCVGQVRPTPRAGDIVSNGADDDGSGSAVLLAIAKAFAEGPKPRRSLLFVWHSGEESGLQGSRYNADYPVVPNEKIVAVLNADMVGRNRCDKESESNTVYLVGSDRISTDLHNVSEDANAALPKPMTLDYEMNDPADPESLYTRSDHYSYAAKGIPVIFYTTGLHKDYHWVTDEVDRIEFDKMARIAQLIHATGARIANLDTPLARDNKGPRAGKGTTGKIK
jgi:hypothetical protein